MLRRSSAHSPPGFFTAQTWYGNFFRVVVILLIAGFVLRYLHDARAWALSGLAGVVTPIQFPPKSEITFRIFDIVLYHNEAYMMLIRLRTLARWVDMHYIGFSLESFSHEVSQPLTFSPFDSEIREFFYHVYWMNYTHPRNITEPWERETDIRHQLIARMEANSKPTDDDLVMWSDLDEVPTPGGMSWVRDHPPKRLYRFNAHFHFYNYRWRCGEKWGWAYVMKYGAKPRGRTWFQLRSPGRREPHVPSISMIHCSYCFPSLGLIIQKLKSFSHREFSSDHWVDPNYVYSYVYCGYSLFGGNYSFVPFDPLGIEVPDDPRFNYLKQRIKFNDLHTFNFSLTLLQKYAPCKLPPLKAIGDLVPGDSVPNDLWD
jgi:hypothetical protein